MISIQRVNPVRFAQKQSPVEEAVEAIRQHLQDNKIEGISVDAYRDMICICYEDGAPTWNNRLSIHQPNSAQGYTHQEALAILEKVPNMTKSRNHFPLAYQGKNQTFNVSVSSPVRPQSAPIIFSKDLL